MKALALATALVIAASAAADAQQLSLAIGGGRVTLEAENVPVRQILEEWARVGGATVVNGESVSGDPVTLWLEDVPEAVALDIILREVSGYVLAPRPLGSPGASVFDRIVVLASSAPPRFAPRPRPISRASAPLPQDGEDDEEVAPSFAVEPEPDVSEQPPVERPSPMGFPFQAPPGSSARPGVSAPPSEAP